MGRLFNRRCEVLIGPPPKTNDFVLLQPNAMRIDGLHCVFKVERDGKANPNNLELSISNLSENSRGKLVGKGFRVVLNAGYEDGVSQVFSGDVRQVTSRKIGTDWVTRIIAGDGERAFQHARVAKSYSKGTSLTDVVIGTVKAIGTDPGNAFAKAQQLIGSFSGGYVQASRASTELTTLLEPHGWTWSIQDGRVELLGPDEYLAGMGPKIATGSGLIGEPEITDPDKKGGKPTIKVRSLMRATLRPGVRFYLASRLRTGTFTVKKVTHTGDTAGGDWYSDIEAST